MTEQNEKKKREYRLGNPLSKTEYNRRVENKKAKEKRLLRLWVPITVADEFKESCKENGIPMSREVTRLIKECLAKKMQQANC